MLTELGMAPCMFWKLWEGALQPQHRLSLGRSYTEACPARGSTSGEIKVRLRDYIQADSTSLLGISSCGQYQSYC